MAEDYKKTNVEDDEKSGGGGNRNALAYGLLQGAGVNTHGLTPSQAWDLVSQMNLMDSHRWKRTDEDKSDIKAKKEEFKKQGKDLEKLKKTAMQYAMNVNFDGVGNLPALEEAIDTVAELMDEYGLRKLHNERVKNLGRAMGAANGSLLNIGQQLIRNPNAAYRICVDGYKKTEKEEIRSIQENLNLTQDLLKKQKMQERLQELFRQQPYSRHNVIYKGEEVKSVITHEMGHVLAAQKFGGFISKKLGGNTNSDENKKIRACYIESLKNGDIKKISAYAEKSPDEFFAECFTMYKMGKEKLPKNIEKMIKEVLKK